MASGGVREQDARLKVSGQVPYALNVELTGMAYAKGIRDLQPPQLGVWDPERLYRPEHMAIFTRYLNVSEQVLRDQVPYTWDPDLVIQGDSIMDIQQTHLRNGVLTLPQPVPLERMIAPGPSEYARQTLGRVRS